MFRLWGKIIKNNRIIADQVFELKSLDLTLEEKIDQGLESLCYHFDIQNLCGSPIMAKILIQ